MIPKPVIYGVEALSLTEAERDFFTSARPFGFILFSRNIESAEQLRALVAELADYSAFDEALVFIDQEGGRVARIRPPIMREYPSAEFFGRLYESDPAKAIEAVRLSARSLAGDLRSFGIRANCAPVCDVACEATHNVIGDRAFGELPEVVAVLAEAQAQGFLQAGVYPVIKHIPGHGRGTADSHETLPIVDASLSDLRARDFVPFRALSKHLFAMTAHILYEVLDGEFPLTLSKRAIDSVVRGEIGFGNLLLSDDLSMKALRGSFADRASNALSAGCDLILHCNGDMAEMESIDSVLGDMAESRLSLFTNRVRGMDISLDLPLWNGEWLDFEATL